MVAKIGDPTGDTGKGAGGTVPETRRKKTTRTAQDSVADKAVTLVGDRTEITAEAEVREGGMLTTPTPPQSLFSRLNPSINVVFDKNLYYLII